MESRPQLLKSIKGDDFKNHYWLKSELVNFCRENGLSTTGSKQELAQRITIFITTGNKVENPLKIDKNVQRDSAKPIMRNTLVVNYRNDAATRQFFVEQIGEGFHFNAYLRRYMKQENITKNLTYGDLVDGWLAESARKKSGHYQSNIGKQFEYNQFTRDYFAHEHGKSRSDVITAWKILKSLSGPKTYTNYKASLLNTKKENGRRGPFKESL